MLGGKYCVLRGSSRRGRGPKGRGFPRTAEHSPDGKHANAILFTGGCDGHCACHEEGVM